MKRDGQSIHRLLRNGTHGDRNSGWSLCTDVNIVCAENFGSRYTAIRDRIGDDEPGDRSKGDIISDITTSFVVLMGIFFPSVTGN